MLVVNELATITKFEGRINLVYKHFELKYGDNPKQTASGLLLKVWLAFVDHRYVGNIDNSDESWFVVFTEAKIPEKYHVQLCEYKRWLGRTSYCHADDGGGDWRFARGHKEKANAIADILLSKDLELDSVLANLREGELL